MEIKICSYKHGNIKHYEWQGELIKHTDDYVIVFCKPERDLIHYSKGVTYTLQNNSLEYFDLKRGFTVAVEIANDEIAKYYVNISSPCTFENGVITYIDYDIDLVKIADTAWVVVDEEEYEENSIKYNYTEEIKQHVEDTIDLLNNLIETKQFPFNETYLDCLKA